MRIRFSAIAGPVCGFLMVAATSLTACGVPEQDGNGVITEELSNGSPERALPTSSTEAAYGLQCVGWDNGARFCLVKCNGGIWEIIGSAPNIPHGQCGYKGISHCGKRGLDSYCWGIKTP